MPDGFVSHDLSIDLSPDEELAVGALVLGRAQARLIEACHEFQDIVMEMEWRLRDYLHLVQARRPDAAAVRQAEGEIRARNAEGMRLHAEIVDLEDRIAVFGRWLGASGGSPVGAPLTPDLVGVLFGRLYDCEHDDTANWRTLAAATLRVFANSRAGLVGPADLPGRFNWLGELVRK